MNNISDWVPSFLRSGAIIQKNMTTFLIAWDLFPSLSQSDIGFFQGNFSLSQTQWWTPRTHREVSLDDLTQALSDYVVPYPTLHWTAYSQSQFLTQFNQILSAINRTNIDKLVAMIEESTPLTDDIHLRATFLFHTLNRNCHYPFNNLYGRWNESGGVLGRSPEHLFDFDSNTNVLKTMAIAGTRLSSDSPDTIINSAKDQAEHEYVVKGITESLEQWGDVRIGPCQPIKSSFFYHLYTPIECHLSVSFNFDAMIRTLHPTPALSGYPQKNALKWIQTHFPDRLHNDFAGLFGMKDARNTYSLLIGIRNIQWTSTQLTISAGCGIVLDSQFTQEWNELTQKINSIKSQFNLLIDES